MPAIPFSRFVAEVTSLYAFPLRAKPTGCKMRQVLKEFAALGPRRTSDVRADLIGRWLLAHQNRAASTNDKLLAAFRAAISYACKSGYLRHSPFDFRRDWVDMADVDDADEAVDRKRHHPLEDIARVLALLEREAETGGWRALRLYALTCVYAYTGMRKMEALQLKVSDIDVDGRIITIRRRKRRRLKTKASAARIGIAEELAPVLARWIKECGSEWLFPGVTRQGPWTGGLPGLKPLDEVKAAGKRAGIEGFTILSLRHSFATHSARWGFSQLGLKTVLRHTTIRTQKEYLHGDDANARALVAGVSFKIKRA